MSCLRGSSRCLGVHAGRTVTVRWSLDADGAVWVTESCFVLGCANGTAEVHVDDLGYLSVPCERVLRVWDGKV